MKKVSPENLKRRETVVSTEFRDFPTDYIKAKCLAKKHGVSMSMAGFEMGEPDAQLVKDPRTGKKRLKVVMNGFLQIEANGECLILDTPFNRMKLRILCKPGTIKVPTDSTGEEFDVVEKGPDFMVEDESIFDGLDEIAEVISTSKKAKNATPGAKMKSGRGLIPAAMVEAQKAAAENEKADNAEGVGGGRRPEGLSLDIQE